MSAPGSPTVSLIVPAYDEEARLGVLFEKLGASAEGDLARAGLSYLETVIVDDGSTDATSSLLQAAAARDVRIRPILGQLRNRGKGAALATGIAAARGEIVLLVDVDLSTPLSCARPLAEAMRAAGTPMAIGSRDLEESRVEAPLHRRLLGAGFNVAVRALTGLRHADTQCGFKMIETGFARELVGDRISQGFAFDVEVLMRARNAGVEVAEVPVTYIHDARSKVRVLRASAEMAGDLLRLAVRLRGGRPRAETQRPR